MIDIRLEGEKMTDPLQAQRHIARRMSFSDDYGKNLDALWEELTNLEDPTAIALYDTELMLEQLGQYGYELLDTFEDAAKANTNIMFEQM